MDVLAAHAARHPEKPALLEGERAWSWAELVARRNRLAHGLIGLGLPPGGHVIVYAENSIEHYLAGAAARAAGLIPAPMNHRLVAEEVVYILDHSDAVAVLVSDRFLPMVESVRARAGKVRRWILLGSERGPYTWMTCSPRAGPIRWRPGRATASARPSSIPGGPPGSPREPCGAGST